MNPVKYSIKDLERLTGIKTHTIRIWEKRHGIIQPDRTETNIRFYSDKELQQLLNISILNRNGLKISQISEMSQQEIVAAVAKLSFSHELVEADINNMVIAAVDLQEDQFERVLNSCLIKLGFERTFCEVIFPLFEKLGILWQIGRINACQDRFITNLVRQKLLVAIDGLSGTNQEIKGTFLLFMPSGHDYEIGLLFANYLLRKNGYQVVYLGPSVPFEHLERLDYPQKFSNLFIGMSLSVSPKENSKYLKKLRKVFPDQLIHLIHPESLSLSIAEDKCVFYSDYESFSKDISA